VTGRPEDDRSDDFGMTHAQAFPLHRTLAPLKERSFDVLVVGGGIYGAWTAYDAALRGLSVALIERDDWASGTSSASSKLIHGGLRYLEHYDFGLVRGALVERRRLHRLAPHLVRPLNFVMPVWKGPRASMLMLSAGLFLYDLLGGRGQPVPWHRRYGAADLLTRYPYVDPVRLLGGFRYGDCQEDDARLTLTVAAAAQGAGAVVANRVAAEQLLVEDGRVVGARVQDRLNRETFELRARLTVNAAGPWAPQLLGAASPRVRRVKGIHILLPAIPGCEEAFLLTAQDGRVFFVIPWNDRTLVGTTEQEIDDPDRVTATDDEVRYLLAGVKNGLPGLPWTEADVIARFAGVRTLQAEDAANLAAVTREFTIAEPQPGVLMPLGGKFTTARCDAVDIVDRVEKLLGRTVHPSQTARRPLPGTPVTGEPFERGQAAVIPLLKARGVDEPCARALTQRHGTGVGRIAELLQEEPRWARRVTPATTLVVAEAVLAARDEMALSLEDVVRRRLPLSLLVRMERSLIKDLADLLAPVWRRDSYELIAEFEGAQPSSR
jgi:glycerol-3-phosphate dehydrogenase